MDQKRKLPIAANLEARDFVIKMLIKFILARISLGRYQKIFCKWLQVYLVERRSIFESRSKMCYYFGSRTMHVRSSRFQFLGDSLDVYRLV